ncbi:MAG: type VI secretion system ATPase TssH [Gammaproteobacteria bacterium]|nr:type VI secretion system ATPase TssH [Gammaproteobacteria bacterium]
MSNLKVLIHKLSPNNRLALEQAANLCVSKTHYEIELEHFFHLLFAQPNNDLAVLSKRYQVAIESLQNDLMTEMETLQKGNQRTPVFSVPLSRLLEQAWLLASIDNETSRIRSGHLLIALLTTPDLRQAAMRTSKRFDEFPIDTIKHKLLELCKLSSETDVSTHHAESIEEEQTNETNTNTQQKTPALDQFTINLTERARNGEIDPVIGREFEIRQMMDILMRRRQNNPILTGEAGVGKTAVVEGMALKISQGQVPEALQHVEIHSLDMGLMQAGASVKGEFENRLKSVINEVRQSPHPIILFIDEAHTLIGAGGQAGQNDAANLLKPALARGELRTIAATTWSEYKQYFEKDAALTRRFQVVKVEEPTVEVAIQMLRAIVPVMSEHFGIVIQDDALIAAATASARYITGRQLPDKAISVLDTAAARVALSQTAQPAAIDRLQAHLHNLNLEQTLLANEQRQIANQEQSERLTEVEIQIKNTTSDLKNLTDRWQQELTLLEKIKAATADIEQSTNTQPELQNNLDQLRTELQKIQAGSPLVYERLDSQIVTEIIADWTGVPVGKMMIDEIQAVLTLEDQLAQRVMGQPHVLHGLTQRIKTARAQLEDPSKPQGVFLFVGPSGVGKTETALALAEELYGGERNLITINMSEYQEAHTVSSLKGSPPGYVGYGQGGVLTEAVRRHPYSVILLDEVEKAHTDVQELFYQVFDKGSLEDGEGRHIDFRNCLIILTSNVGSSTIMQHCINQSVADRPNPARMLGLLQPSLHQAFKPAFLGRTTIIPFYPMHDDLLAQIIEHKLSKIIQRLHHRHRTTLSYDDDLIELILARCTEVDSGARNIDHILSGTVLPQLASHLLTAMVDGKTPSHIHITVSSDDQIHYHLTNPISATQTKETTKSKKKTNQKTKTKVIENA